MKNQTMWVSTLLPLVWIWDGTFLVATVTTMAVAGASWKHGWVLGLLFYFHFVPIKHQFLLPTLKTQKERWPSNLLSFTSYSFLILIKVNCILMYLVCNIDKEMWGRWYAFWRWWVLETQNEWTSVALWQYGVRMNCIDAEVLSLSDISDIVVLSSK